ncbi:MAG: aminoglycoside 3'-phosphotransferase [Ruminococcaceae bacterium]|nr:aminoglycoside 3'-phosphotransferase [Oscillospiraceae bacterium]
MLNIPENMAEILSRRQFSADTIGLSGAQVLCSDDMVLKIERNSVSADNEHRMLAWLQGRLPVPEIIAFERAEGYNYLLMSRIADRMLCSDDILSDGGRLVELAAQSCGLLWSADISDCPVSASLDHKLRLAAERVAGGLCSVEDAEPETYGPGGFASPEQLLRWLEDNRPEERPVLTHGDLCLPNIFTDGSRITGFIDLGRSGAADMHADLALLLRSIRHNLNGIYGGKKYPPVEPRLIFERLGISPDPEQLRYYLLLDELF